MKIEPHINRKGLKNEWCNGDVRIARFYDGAVHRNIYRIDWIEKGIITGKDVYGTEGDTKVLPRIISGLPPKVRDVVPALEWDA